MIKDLWLHVARDLWDLGKVKESSKDPPRILQDRGAWQRDRNNKKHKGKISTSWKQTKMKQIIKNVADNKGEKSPEKKNPWKNPRKILKEFWKDRKSKQKRYEIEWWTYMADGRLKRRASVCEAKKSVTWPTSDCVEFKLQRRWASALSSSKQSTATVQPALSIDTHEHLCYFIYIYIYISLSLLFLFIHFSHPLSHLPAPSLLAENPQRIFRSLLRISKDFKETRI